jgi:hypothetical protein
MIDVDCWKTYFAFLHLLGWHGSISEMAGHSVENLALALTDDFGVLGATRVAFKFTRLARKRSTYVFLSTMPLSLLQRRFPIVALYDRLYLY